MTKKQTDSRVIVFASPEYYPGLDNCIGIFQNLKDASKFAKNHKKVRGYDFYELINLQKWIAKNTILVDNTL